MKEAEYAREQAEVASAGGAMGESLFCLAAARYVCWALCPAQYGYKCLVDAAKALASAKEHEKDPYKKRTQEARKWLSGLEETSKPGELYDMFKNLPWHKWSREQKLMFLCVIATCRRAKVEEVSDEIVDFARKVFFNVLDSLQSQRDKLEWAEDKLDMESLMTFSAAMVCGLALGQEKVIVQFPVDVTSEQKTEIHESLTAHPPKVTFKDCNAFIPVTEDWSLDTIKTKLGTDLPTDWTDGTRIDMEKCKYVIVEFPKNITKKQQGTIQKSLLKHPPKVEFKDCKAFIYTTKHWLLDTIKTQLGKDLGTKWSIDWGKSQDVIVHFPKNITTEQKEKIQASLTPDRPKVDFKDCKAFIYTTKHWSLDRIRKNLDTELRTKWPGGTTIDQDTAEKNGLGPAAIHPARIFTSVPLSDLVWSFRWDAVSAMPWHFPWPDRDARKQLVQRASGLLDHEDWYLAHLDEQAGNKEWPMSTECRSNFWHFRTKPALLLLRGKMDPVHKGHREAMLTAKEALQREGYHVLGAWMSPFHQDQPGANIKLGPKLRRQLVEESLADLAWVSCGAWESSQSERPTEEEVLESLKSHFLQTVDYPEDKLIKEDKFQIFTICRGEKMDNLQVRGQHLSQEAPECGPGVELADDDELQAPTQTHGDRDGVVINQQANTITTPIFLWNPHILDVRPSTPIELRGKLVRELLRFPMLRHGILKDLMILPKVASLLLRPEPAKYLEFKDDFDGIQVPPKRPKPGPKATEDSQPLPEEMLLMARDCLFEELNKVLGRSLECVQKDEDVGRKLMNWVRYWGSEQTLELLQLKDMACAQGLNVKMQKGYEEWYENTLEPEIQRYCTCPPKEVCYLNKLFSKAFKQKRVAKKSVELNLWRLSDWGMMRGDET